MHRPAENGLNLSDKEFLLELVKFKKTKMEKTKFHQTDKPKTSKEGETKTIPAEVKRQVYQRSQRKCEKCQGSYRLEFHHLTPRSFGGKHEVGNLKLLCRNCHARESFTQGFRVPGMSVNAATVAALGK